MIIPLVTPILAQNQRQAQDNRARLERYGVLAVNVLGSPGAGKTSLILAACEVLELRTAVIEGDVASCRDAEAVARAGLPVVQINTEGSCHLDADMVGRALDLLELEGLDLVFIENVGNLICPVSFDLGAQLTLLAASVPEGSDKPYKYPAAFQKSDLVVLTKTDLASVCGFERATFVAGLEALRPGGPLLETSSRTGAGIPALVHWLRAHLPHPPMLDHHRAGH